MQKRLLFLSLILVVSSCVFNRKSSPYKGYILYTEGIYYKYADIGTKQGRIAPGETMEVYINYSRMDGSVFWDSRGLWYPFSILIPYDSILKGDNYRKVLLKCNEGDSINVIINKALLFLNFSFNF